MAKLKRARKGAKAHQNFPKSSRATRKLRAVAGRLVSERRNIFKDRRGGSMVNTESEMKSLAKAMGDRKKRKKSMLSKIFGGGK